MAHGYYNLQGNWVPTDTLEEATAAWRAERGYNPYGAFDMGDHVVDTRNLSPQQPKQPEEVVEEAPVGADFVAGGSSTRFDTENPELRFTESSLEQAGDFWEQEDYADTVAKIQANTFSAGDPELLKRFGGDHPLSTPLAHPDDDLKMSSLLPGVSQGDPALLAEWQMQNQLDYNKQLSEVQIALDADVARTEAEMSDLIARRYHLDGQISDAEQRALPTAGLREELATVEASLETIQNTLYEVKDKRIEEGPRSTMFMGRDPANPDEYGVFSVVSPESGALWRIMDFADTFPGFTTIPRTFLADVRARNPYLYDAVSYIGTQATESFDTMVAYGTQGFVMAKPAFDLTFAGLDTIGEESVQWAVARGIEEPNHAWFYQKAIISKLVADVGVEGTMTPFGYLAAFGSNWLNLTMAQLGSLAEDDEIMSFEEFMGPLVPLVSSTSTLPEKLQALTDMYKAAYTLSKGFGVDPPEGYSQTPYMMQEMYELFPRLGELDQIYSEELIRDEDLREQADQLYSAGIEYSKAGDVELARESIRNAMEIENQIFSNDLGGDRQWRSRFTYAMSLRKDDYKEWMEDAYANFVTEHQRFPEEWETRQISSMYVDPSVELAGEMLFDVSNLLGLAGIDNMLMKPTLAFGKNILRGAVDLSGAATRKVLGNTVVDAIRNYVVGLSTFSAASKLSNRFAEVTGFLSASLRRVDDLARVLTGAATGTPDDLLKVRHIEHILKVSDSLGWEADDIGKLISKARSQAYDAELRKLVQELGAALPSDERRLFEAMMKQGMDNPAMKARMAREFGAEAAERMWPGYEEALARVQSLAGEYSELSKNVHPFIRKNIMNDFMQKEAVWYGGPSERSVAGMLAKRAGLDEAYRAKISILGKPVTVTRRLYEIPSSVYKYAMSLWTRAILTWRPGFTVINFMDSTFRMLIHGGKPWASLVELKKMIPWWPDELMHGFMDVMLGGRPLSELLEVGEKLTLFSVFNEGGFRAVNSWFEASLRMKLYAPRYLADASIARTVIAGKLDDILAPIFDTRVGNVIDEIMNIHGAHNPEVAREMVQNLTEGIFSGDRPAWLAMFPKEQRKALEELLGVDNANMILQRLGAEVREMLEGNTFTAEAYGNMLDELLGEVQLTHAQAMDAARGMDDISGPPKNVPDAPEMGTVDDIPAENAPRTSREKARDAETGAVSDEGVKVSSETVANTEDEILGQIDGTWGDDAVEEIGSARLVGEGLFGPSENPQGVSDWRAKLGSARVARTQAGRALANTHAQLGGIIRAAKVIENLPEGVVATELREAMLTYVNEQMKFISGPLNTWMVEAFPGPRIGGLHPTEMSNRWLWYHTARTNVYEAGSKYADNLLDAFDRGAWEEIIAMEPPTIKEFLEEAGFSIRVSDDLPAGISHTASPRPEFYDTYALNSLLEKLGITIDEIDLPYGAGVWDSDVDRWGKSIRKRNKAAGTVGKTRTEKMVSPDQDWVDLVDDLDSKFTTHSKKIADKQEGHVLPEGSFRTRLNEAIEAGDEMAQAGFLGDTATRETLENYAKALGIEYDDLVTALFDGTAPDSAVVKARWNTILGMPDPLNPEKTLGDLYSTGTRYKSRSDIKDYDSLATAMKKQITNLIGEGKHEEASAIAQRLQYLNKNWEAVRRASGEALPISANVPLFRWLPEGAQTRLRHAGTSIDALNDLTGWLDNYKAWMNEAVDEGSHWFAKFTTEEKEILEAFGKRYGDLLTEGLAAVNYGGDFHGVGFEGAVNFVNKVMLDYTQFSNIEGTLKHAMPFWMFPTRTIPMWAETFARKPWLFSAYTKYIRGTMRLQYLTGALTQDGIPLPSLRGYVPIPGTEIYFNPTAQLSMKYLFPLYDNLHQQEEESHASIMGQALRWFYNTGTSFGLYPNPIVTALMYATQGLDREENPPFALVPQAGLIPPNVHRWLAMATAKLIGVPGSNMIKSQLNPEEGWMDWNVEKNLYEWALWQIQEMDANPEMIVAQVKMALLYRDNFVTNEEGTKMLANPDAASTWMEARDRVEASDYYRQTVGFFSGSYVKEFTGGDAYVIEVRRDINQLRIALNNTLGRTLFDLDMEMDALWSLYIQERYNTPEGVIYGLYGSGYAEYDPLSFNLIEAGIAEGDLSVGGEPTLEGTMEGAETLTDIGDTEQFTQAGNSTQTQERRKAITTKIIQDEHTDALLTYKGMIMKEFEDGMREIKMIAPTGDMTDPLYQRLGEAFNPLFMRSMFPFARESAGVIGAKPYEIVLEEAIERGWQALEMTRPRWDPAEYDSYKEYEQALETWIAAIPTNVETLLGSWDPYIIPGKEEEDEDTVMEFINPELNMPPKEEVLANMLILATPDGYETRRKLNMSLDEAIFEVYYTEYGDEWWKAIDGLSGDALRIAKNDFDTKWGEDGPTLSMIKQWIMEDPIFSVMFRDDEIDTALHGRDAWSTEQRLQHSRGIELDDSVLASKEQQVWDIFGSLDPGGERNDFTQELNQRLGGEAEYMTSLFMNKGGFENMTDEEAEEFHTAVKEAADAVGIEEPTQEELTERVKAKELNEKFKISVKRELGDDFYELYYFYNDLSSTAKRAFKEDNPEDAARIQRYYDMHDEWEAMYPLWADFWGWNTTDDQKGYGSSKSKAKVAKAVKTTMGPKRPEMSDIRMGKRSTMSATMLPQTMGRGGVTGRLVWPPSLTVADALKEQVEELMESDKPLPPEAETYIKNVIKRNPKHQEFLELIMEKQAAVGTGVQEF